VAAAQQMREMRPTIGHNSQGRVQVTNRAGEVVSRSSAQSGVDQFHVPPGIIPQGWSWEWKRESVNGMTEPSYIAEMTQVGWEPVMAESYPGVFQPASMPGPIRRKGLMLMERRIELTHEASRDEKRRADERVGNSIRKHGALNTQGSQTEALGRAHSYIKQSTEYDVRPPLDRGAPIE
jgi:hypothetical protein